jgi:hypothetical protein
MNRLRRKFVKDSTQKLETGPARVHLAAFATALGDGSNPAKLLELWHRLIAVAVGTESHQETGGRASSAAGRPRPQRVIPMLREELGDPGLHLLDGSCT